ncbi:hypothetical protein LTS18_007920, partial [Coniosporium uncinatum]
MSSSDLSDLSSAPPTDDEMPTVVPKSGGTGKIKKYLKSSSSATEVPSPERKKRPASPPHEEVLADNSDIAVLVMFRSRFNDAFGARVPHFGPQDIERGVVDQLPSPQVENLLCALLGLVLNRKKPI